MWIKWQGMHFQEILISTKPQQLTWKNMASIVELQQWGLIQKNLKTKSIKIQNQQSKLRSVQKVLVLSIVRDLRAHNSVIEMKISIDHLIREILREG